MAEAPILRRWIHATLVFDHGKHPVAVTNALSKLRAGQYTLPDVRHAEIEYKGDSKPSHLYTYARDPYASELRYLKELVHCRQVVFERNLIGRVGERFVRSALIASGQFHNVTAIHRLGKLADQYGKNKLDIRATGQDGIEYGLSVRNRHEHLHNRGWIKDAHDKAKAHGVKPWLVVPFATAEGLRKCRAAQVRVTVLGSQIIPAKIEVPSKTGPVLRSAHLLIRRLRPLIGPQPIHVANAQVERNDPIFAAFRRGEITFG